MRNQHALPEFVGPFSLCALIYVKGVTRISLFWASQYRWHRFYSSGRRISKARDKQSSTVEKEELSEGFKGIRAEPLLNHLRWRNN